MSPRLARSGPRTTLAGLLVTAAIALAGGLLGAPSLLALAVQASMAEWGATRLDAAWTFEGTASGAGRAPAGRAARGAALGLAAAGATYGLAAATGAIVAIVPTLTGVLLLLSAAGDALLGSVRDELWLHGLVLRVASPPPDRLGPRLLALAACGAASAAWALGEAGDAGLPLGRLAFETLAGAAFGALWLVDRGAWLPVAAHGAFRFVTRGATYAAPAATAWGGGSGGLFAGGAAVVVAAVACGAAAVAVGRTTWAPRENGPPRGPLG